MPACFPHPRIHDDGAIDANHLNFLAIRAQRRIAHHVLPPAFLDISLEFNAERPVVPEAVDTAIDFARLENEPTPLAQRYQFFHVHLSPPSEPAQLIASAALLSSR